MLVLGLSGWFNTPEDQLIPLLSPKFFHDSAAVLIRDGIVLAAVEEERLNRIKHTNYFPHLAVRFCMDKASVGLEALDRIAYFFGEQFTDREGRNESARGRNPWPPPARELLAQRLEQCGKGEIDPRKIDFVPHHLSHATSAFFDSGWTNALVAVFDGNGEQESGSIFLASPGSLEVLATYPTAGSLGHFYSAGTRFLGFGHFDEYKVMGLAPYGEAAKLWPLFSSSLRLESDGRYQLDASTLGDAVLHFGLRPRAPTATIDPIHCDFAAGLQRLLELVMEHVLRHWQRETGQSNLCLAGGVAHNCAMTGRIARAGGFKGLFVHPASHDAGAALGAAFWAGTPKGQALGRTRRLRSVAWGPKYASPSDLVGLRELWKDLIDCRRYEDISEQAADLIAAGAILGWMHGGSEFGPRALGNRSILADPRPSANRDRVNLAIKKRESFRPFAPAVLEEFADDYFDMVSGIEDPEFMVFVVPVREDKQQLLRAVTHVDGTARVQVVDRKHAPHFWRLIHCFGLVTGVPVLLNTSFNNYAEPIVQSASDGLRCFLTTDLDGLVLDSWLIRKKCAVLHVIDRLYPCLMPNTKLQAATVAFNYAGSPARSVSIETHTVLARSDGTRSLQTLCGGEVPQATRIELMQLWQDRLVDMLPARR
jgi:predicted NodU family carbamoyl transferase